MDEAHRELTPEYASRLPTAGFIAQINLDNCSLQRMEKLPPKPTILDAEANGLLPLVRILQSAPVALSAIGINEMPDRHVISARQGYERFCAAFWPGHKDDVEATHRSFDGNSNQRQIEFTALGDGARCTYGAAYVALLQMQNIHRSYPSLGPAEKFDVYLHSIVRMLDIVSAFELEIAKYAFWTPTPGDFNCLPAAVLQRRSDIKENFTRLQGTVARCKHAAFNGAMDLHWLSGANMSEDMGITLAVGTTRLMVDQWLGTNDIKLYRICRDMHSVWHEGSRQKRFASTREPKLAEQPYWRDVDNRAAGILSFRMSQNHGSADLLDRIDRAVKYVENQLRAVLPE